MAKNRYKDYKVGKNKVVLYDGYNTQNKKMSVERKMDNGGDIKITLSTEDGPKLFWMNKVQIQVMIETLLLVRDHKKNYVFNDSHINIKF